MIGKGSLKPCARLVAPKRRCKNTFFPESMVMILPEKVINIFPMRHAPLRSASLRADEWASQAATSACGCRLRLVKFPPHDLKHQGCHSLRFTGFCSAASRSAAQRQAAPWRIRRCTTASRPLGDLARWPCHPVRCAHRWRCRRAAVSGSLRYRECLRRLSIRIDTPHARLVSSLTHQVSLRSI